MLQKIRPLTVLALFVALLVKDTQTAVFDIDIKIRDELAAGIDLARNIRIHVTVLAEIQFADLIVKEADTSVLLLDRFLQHRDRIIFLGFKQSSHFLCPPHSAVRHRPQTPLIIYGQTGINKKISYFASIIAISPASRPRRA